MILKPIFYYDKESIYSTPYEAWASNNECYLHYYDDIFDKADWKKEPTETLETLYVERARKIRDEYEYVILCYSGGNDSTKILETFYYNNIHIDEIVMVGSFSQDANSGSDENHNTDFYQNAFPLLKTLDLPNTKITTIDYTEIFRDINQFSLIKNYGIDWIKYIGTTKSPHNLFWSDFKKFVGPNNTKNTAWIMGIEKVNLEYWYQTAANPSEAHSYINLSKPYVHFSDAYINNYGMSTRKDENFTRVNFYCDPDPVAIKIQIKQAHIFHRVISMSPLHLRRKIIRSRHMKNKLFYDLKNPLTFQSEKSRTSVLSLRDKFLFNAKNSDIYEYYISAIGVDQEYIKTQTTQKWTYNTRPYFIK
jgi:hypothetical protein